MEKNSVELWKHQKDAISIAKKLNYFALFWEPGTGKTRAMIEILKEQTAENTLILCPLIVVKNWEDEIKKYWGRNNVFTLTGSEKKRITTVMNAPKKSILIMNYEGLLMPNLMRALEKWWVEVLVCDESHKCKNHTSKRTQAAIKLADHAFRRFLLTGTPVLNSSQDIFAQFRILDRGERFGRNFFGFRNTYFFDMNAAMKHHHNYFPNWQPRHTKKAELTEKVSSCATHVKKADCLDLPPILRQTISLQMTPTQKQAYEQMRADYITFVRSGKDTKASVATLAITKALRLMQIASGFIKLEDNTVMHFESTPKLAALKELLEDLTPNHKVIVWCVFIENYKAIKEVCNSIGVKYVEVHGEISNAKKFEAVENFRNERDIRVYIGHPMSGGIGINLVEAAYSIFYSKNFSLEADIQAEARNYRAGSEQHKSITRIDLVCADSLEEKITVSLSSKQQIGESVLTGMIENDC